MLTFFLIFMLAILDVDFTVPSETLKCFKEEEEEEEVLMYSGIEFQIKVPEKLNKLQFKSVFGIGV